MSSKDRHSNGDLLQENIALKEELANLKKRKKFGLVWEEKPEDVVARCLNELPVLKEDANLAIGKDETLPTNLLIEGDNYHALSVLNYTHADKIDVIYIDPPYNTGARDWKYNNDYVDKEDGYRHSKWLSMMKNRLQMAKWLLSKSGFICVAIDHNELFTLGCLLDKVFGEPNRLGIVSVVIKTEGRQFAKFFSVSNEYMLVYARNIDAAKFNHGVIISDSKKEEFAYEDEAGKYKLRKYINYNVVELSGRETNLESWYPFYVNPKNLSEISLDCKPGFAKIYPIHNGVEKSWQTQIDKARERLNANELVCQEVQKGQYEIFLKIRESQRFVTVWNDTKYTANANGTKLLAKLIGKSGFAYPKSVFAVLDFLKITSKKDSIILDFFAGSGTTAHAVALLNKEDGGNRQYILCTNNENGIAREVCYPRIKAVIDGHAKLPKLTGMRSNLRYYTTDFVEAESTDANKIELTNLAADMLCVRENTFTLIKETKAYKIFRNQNRYTGIIYNSAKIDNFKKAITKFDGVFNVYVFSLGAEDFSDDFVDMRGKVTTQPIPESILKIYRRVFTKGAKP